MTVLNKKTGPALIIGQSPPPYNGMSVATELVKKALSGTLPIIHLDTSDRRGLSNVGKLDFINMFLAMFHGAKCLWILLSEWPVVVYVPISQAWLPFLRDCLFLIPARILRRKVVIHLHGGHFGCFYRETSPVMRAIVRYALRDVSSAIVLGLNVRNVFDGLVPRSRVHVVPNGIPDAFADQRFREAKRVNEQRLVLLYLGTLVAAKGLLDLLRALSKVPVGVGTRIKVVFAGEWYSRSDKKAAHELIERANLRAMVEFSGPVEPEMKNQLLCEASILLLPSENEGQPYVILEGMSAGLPIISTNIACIPETVRDGVDGFLIVPHDVDALAERISRLIQDGGLRSRMGRNSRDRFLQGYTYDKFAEAMRAIFRETAQNWN